MMRLIAACTIAWLVGVSPGQAFTSNWFCFFDGRVSGLELDEPLDRCRLMLEEFVTRWRQLLLGAYRDPTQPDRQPRPNLARVWVIGHDEDVGTPDAALLRSAARAVWVTRELIRLGIPGDLITITAYGSNRLLVPTQGVEPQNRRVELVFR